jgi:hypothetical protein
MGKRGAMAFAARCFLAAALSLFLPFAIVAANVPAEAQQSPPASPPVDSDVAKATVLAKTIFKQLQSGEVDRHLLNGTISATLTPARVTAISSALAPLGQPLSFTFLERFPGELPIYKFRLVWGAVSFDESIAVNAAGKIAAFQLREFAPIPGASQSITDPSQI